MNVTSKIRADLTRPGVAEHVYAVQNDRLTHRVEIALYSGGTAWEIPTGVLVSIRYAKPDGTGGDYSTADDGAIAYFFYENTVTISLVEQMLTVPGIVPVEVNFYTGNGTSAQKLTTFRFLLHVTASVVTDEEIVSSDYYNVFTAEAAQIASYAAMVRAAYGAPRVASTAAAMTDHSFIYVYTGSESGYTNGNWYYWNGSAWASGGIYNSAAVQTDTSLSVSGAAADAKAAGDAIRANRAAIDYFNNTQRGLMMKQTVTGTRYTIIDVALAAGTYTFACDGITSSDTDASKCLVTFADTTGGSAVTVASLTLNRGVAVSVSVTLDRATDKMYFFASDTSAHSAGDSFTYSNAAVSKSLTDPGLTVSGGLADAKATGDALGALAADVDAIAARVSGLDDSLYVFGASELLVNNAFLKISGAAQANNSYKCSNFIPVKSGQIIKYGLYGTATAAIICFYTADSESAFSAYVAGTGTFAEGTYTAPAAGFVRFATSSSTVAKSYFYTAAKMSPNFPKNDSIESTLNILLLGDSIFGNDGEIAGDLNELCQSCVNGAFGGTRVTVRGSGDWQYFDGVNITQALASQTWDAQDAAAANLSTDYAWITSRLAGLKAVDMSQVDVICMDWGTNDYSAGCTIEQITAAYSTVIDTLQTAFPTIRLLICTPIWRCWGDESDNDNGDNHIVAVSTLKEIALAIEQFAKDKRISVLQAYQNMPLSYKTRDTYFDAIGSGNTGTSYTHLNRAGNQVYAYLIHGKLRSIY